jgi:hypothetical protein
MEAEGGVDVQFQTLIISALDFGIYQWVLGSL